MSKPDISVEAVERAIEAFNAFPSYATISDAGRIVDQLPPLLRELRSSLTASGEQISAIKELKSYQAGQISTYSDVYLAADVRAILAKGETK